MKMDTFLNMPIEAKQILLTLIVDILGLLSKPENQDGDVLWERFDKCLTHFLISETFDILIAMMFVRWIVCLKTGQMRRIEKP